jgi:hypothetical protein
MAVVAEVVQVAIQRMVVIQVLVDVAVPAYYHLSLILIMVEVAAVALLVPVLMVLAGLVVVGSAPALHHCKRSQALLARAVVAAETILQVDYSAEVAEAGCY